MMNIGVRPTVADNQETRLEVHILDFAGDIYDRMVHVEFRERLREEKKFDSLTALKDQLDRDLEHCKRALGLVF
jgi:riboflavin kinase / FMN adenylyltransferase